MGWTDNFAGRREARVFRLHFKTMRLDPTSIVKSLGQQKEKDPRSEIREAYLSDSQE